jgi:hypothetical protein
MPRRFLLISTTGSPSAAETQPDGYGRTEARLWTRPLRPLTPETSLGFEVIEFARLFLGVVLYPWQQWLLIHALELRPDGRYRFRRVIVLVGRQNGKTTLAAVLAAWWLFVDSDRFPDRIPPMHFKVMGTAQNLDTAEDVWNRVGEWCDKDVESHNASLASEVAAIRRKNGSPGIHLRSRAHYVVRAASRQGGRGKAAARVIMDEIREQLNWEAWDSVSQTTKAVFNSQLWAFSNAGDARSVVLRMQRDKALRELKDWLAQGIDEAEAWANGTVLEGPSTGIFEWSAPEGCEPRDVDGILQANPSIGYGEITVESCLEDEGSMPESSFRTEVLCQWVTADVLSHVSSADWGKLKDAASEIVPGSPLVLGVDSSFDRDRTYIAVAGMRADGLAHVEIVAARGGMDWVVGAVRRLVREQGVSRVVIQERGCPARDFIEPLRDAGVDVYALGGSDLGSATGLLADRVRDGKVRHLGQPVADVSVSGTVARSLGDQLVWDRKGSIVDAAPVVALSWALFGLEAPREVPVVSAYESSELLVI